MTGLWKLRLIAAVAVGGFATVGASATALEVRSSQAVPHVQPSPSKAATVPALAGLVVDQAGAPLAAAVVSIIGPTASIAITNSAGRFTVSSLAAGRYLVQARMVGRRPSPPLAVEIGSRGGLSVQTRLVLVPANSTQADTSAIVEYPVLAAGFGPAEEETAEASDPSNPRETAWRIRHLRRSVLKDAEVAAVDTDDHAAPGNWLAGALDQPAAGLPDFGAFSSVSGQLNLLTVGSFDNPQQIFSADGFSHGVAYLSIGSSASDRTAWTVRGAMTEGDFASWVLAGTYIADLGDHHRYHVGLIYGTQRPDRTSALAVDQSVEGGRDIGILKGQDVWTLSSKVAVSYGVDYTRYDYANGHGLLDPNAAVTMGAGRVFVIRASATQQSSAPGSEELMLPTADGIWLPPQHAVAMLPDEADVAPERARQYRLEIERPLGPGSSVRVGAFYQQVDDQLATVFDLDDSAQAMPRYVVADSGDVSARGYDVTLTHAITSRVHASVAYATSTADWRPGSGLLLVAPFAARTGSEHLQDVSTSLETDIPETATHVLMLYRINTGFAARSDENQPGLGYRFDVRVTQGLPFLNFSGTEWQALVGVRNFFRDSATTASGYDELLVVRPPKRIVGGLMLRF
ncbi:MAG TPA: TonB-dependent receptor [Vicinamibacterales bacterium]